MLDKSREEGQAGEFQLEDVGRELTSSLEVADTEKRLAQQNAMGAIGNAMSAGRKGVAELKKIEFEVDGEIVAAESGNLS